MTKRMLIDATHAEETRVVVLDGNRLEDFDVESSTKKQLKGNIYLAKVVRVEPSLQAAFVEYGGNRHGFLAFSEIHPDYYQIPVADRQRLLAMQEAEARAEEEAEDNEYDTARAVPTGEAAPMIEGVAEPAEGEAPAEAAAPETVTSETVTSEAVTSEAVSPEAGAAIALDASAPAEIEAATEQAPAAEDGEDASAMPPAPPPETMGGEHDTGEEREQRQASRHLRGYKIQEVIRRRQILLIQVVKEERGTKGAALTTYISLAGRFCVLMPNSPRGGGVSRKITSAADRKRLREVMTELDIPRGMGMIVRTAGANRPKPEIKRDCEYLLRLWDDIREKTMASVAPALINEEASLIKRAIRDVYSRDLDEILVDGEDGWRAARDFMRQLMPGHARKVILWKDSSAAGAQSLFARQQVEAQLDAMMSPTVQLRSGGYLVINQTEALVAIDVNSGRSTRERGIEETALRTNLEAAEEAARQLRLRDLAGLIVIDFIDMESKKHNAMVERRLKEALKADRARIQVGQISHFGLMEMSRQRLRPSLAETSFVTCPHCNGLGHVRSTESSSMHVLRAIEEEGAKRRAAEIVVHCAGSIALYVLNHKRAWLAEIEARHFMQISFAADDSLLPPAVRIDRIRPQLPPEELPSAPVQARPAISAAEMADDDVTEAPDEIDEVETEEAPARVVQEARAPQEARQQEGRPQDGQAETSEESEQRRRRRRRRRRGGRREDGAQMGANEDGTPMDLDAEQPDIGDFAASHEAAPQQATIPAEAASEPVPVASEAAAPGEPTAEGAEPQGEHAGEDEAGQAARRRGRRGGRRRRSGTGEERVEQQPAAPVYAGPTPADPFGGHTFDIFDVIEQQQQQEEAARPAATVREVPIAAAPAPEAAPALQAAPQPAPEPVAEAAAPEPTPPEPTPAEVVQTEVAQAEPVGAEPVASAPAEVEAATAAEPAPAELPLEEAPAAKAKKPRAPRKPRAKKAAAAELPVTEPEAASPEAPAAETPAIEAPAIEEPAVAPAIEAVHADPVAPAAPVEAADAAAATEEPAQPAIRPVLVGVDSAPAEKKRGWWRR